MVAAASAPLVVLSGSAALLLPELGLAARGHSLLIAGKAALTLTMIVNHLLQAFKYAPRSTPGEHGGPDPTPEAWHSWVRLLTLNVVLGFAAFFLGLLSASR